MPDTSLHRPVVESYEYATDYDPDDTSSGTWVTIPRSQILAEGYQPPIEEPATANGMNSNEMMAMVLIRAVLPFALKADDTWQNALKTATTNITPIWLRLKELGKDTRQVIGGQFGLTCVYSGQAVPSPGQLGMSTAAFTGPANESGQGFQEYTPGSGS